MFSHRLTPAAGVASIFLIGASVAIACGPYFPWQLLDDRKTTLRETPHNSFVFEASHLVPTPHDGLKPNEPPSYDYTDQLKADRLKAEQQGLSSTQQSLINVMRNASNDAAAYAAGDGLPEPVRLYTTGAVDFGASDRPNAAKRFAQILALPSAQRAPRATWSAFMAGRTAAFSNDDAKAIAMYALTRKLAREGSPDPLGLAVASYGEQARLHYDDANGFLEIATPGIPNATAAFIPANPSYKGYVLPHGREKTFRDQMTVAATLYAEQAAYGSDSGVQSLRMIAEDVLADQSRMEAAVSSPLLERLVVDYVLSRIADDPGHDEGTSDAGMGPPDPEPNPVLPRLVDAIVQSGNADPAGADRLASLSYLLGRYDLAAKMADKSSSPLAEWVKAKLALQKGDLAAAAAHYAKASQGFPRAEESGALDSSNLALVVGESGTLSLARGEYIDALETLYPVSAPYWSDVAYIAERVLTVDELKAFVDSRTGPSPKKPTDASYWSPADPAAQLRDLLARRLMRDGRYAAALPYFSDPKLRALAARYATALHEGETDWLPVARAEAYFTAAKIARDSGMEILGDEGAPDYFALGGSYDTGIGQDKPKGPFVTPDEIARAAASTAKPNARFHYRYIALDEAAKAADLVPARSQAFAAMLCRADGWMQQTPGEQARVKAIYRRYVAQGARVPFAADFGWKCPEPNFGSASALEEKQLYRHWRHMASRYRWQLAGGLGLLVLALATIVFFARRRR